MDRTTKILLAAIALGLWVNAGVSALRPAVAQIPLYGGARTIFEVQKLWEAFKEAEIANEWKGGTGWRMLYHLTKATIIKNRTRELTSG
jgi:hypothetical protein